MAQELKTAAPEQQGIPSGAILAFLQALEGEGIPLHSFLLMRRGVLVSETYYKPYTCAAPHRMFSITKSMVSLAIGLLCAQGRLGLEDKIVDYFPDKQPPQGAWPRMRELTIRRMLTMQTPHSTNAYKVLGGPDWVADFFALPPDHDAGTCFSYDTASTHTLAALVERLTGRELIDFLNEYLFAPLGADGTAYCLKDPSGTSQGGSGLVCTPRDLARVMQLLLQNGSWQGRQLLPAEYLAQALRRQVSTFARSNDNTPDEQQGYGYQFWRTTHNGFACYGMGGQLGVCLPAEELVFVTTADTQGIPGGTQRIYDAFWQLIYPRLCPEPLPADGAVYPALLAHSRGCSLPCVPLGAEQPAEPARPRHWLLEENPGGFRELWLAFGPAGGTLRWRDAGGLRELPFGLGCNVPGVFPENALPCAASGGWLDADTFAVKCQLVGAVIGSVLFQISTCGPRATLTLAKREETLLARFDGVIGAVESTL